MGLGRGADGVAAEGNGVEGVPGPVDAAARIEAVSLGVGRGQTEVVRDAGCRGVVLRSKNRLHHESIFSSVNL